MTIIVQEDCTRNILLFVSYSNYTYSLHIEENKIKGKAHLNCAFSALSHCAFCLFFIFFFPVFDLYKSLVAAGSFVFLLPFFK